MKLCCRCLANLLAGLVAYQEEVGTRVVDSVLEDIRLGMEVNLPKFNQRRVAQIKYLGELYNYRMVESADIFKVNTSLFYKISLMLFIQGVVLFNNIRSFNGFKQSVTIGSTKSSF